MAVGVVARVQDLIAWQMADRFEVEVLRLIRESPKAARDWKYRDQILDSSSGVAPHISEGFLRCSAGDFCRFLDYALGSLAEAEQRLHSGIRREYFAAADCEPAFLLARRCLTATVRLKRSQRRGPKRGKKNCKGS
jgi:four helix bundle protein